MHISKSDSAHSVFHSQSEWEAMLSAISAPFEKAEPGDVAWQPEYVQEVEPDEDPQEPDEPAQTEGGVPVNDVLRLMQGFIDGLKGLTINVQAPTIHPVIDVKLPQTERITTVERDERGRLASSKTVERPIQ